MPNSSHTTAVPLYATTQSHRTSPSSTTPPRASPGKTTPRSASEVKDHLAEIPVIAVLVGTAICGAYFILNDFVRGVASLPVADLMNLVR